MSKEADFLIYCMERYRYLKKLSGADVAKIVGKYLDDPEKYLEVDDLGY